MTSPKLESPPVREPQTEMALPGPGPRFPRDSFVQRLGWACLASVLVNLFLWWHAAGFVRRHIVMPSPPIEVQLITLTKTQHPKPKPPKKIVKTRPIVKPKIKPIVKPKLIVKPLPLRRLRPVVRPKPIASPPAHNHILISKGPGPTTHTALASGHAQIGKTIAHQNVGEGHDNNQPPQPQPQPKPQPQPEPKPQPKPEPQPEPKPQPQPEPKPQPKPAPAGPTQDAQFDPGPSPEIPDELKSESFKSFVRVRVIVRADGSFTPVLRTSSGNSDIDRLILDALKRYGKAKPALQTGVPVESTFLFKYEIEVQ